MAIDSAAPARLRTTPRASGIFRRHIRITTTPTEAHAEVEDDFHRFGVDIIHDGEKLIRVTGREIRTPWNTCRHAGGMLKLLDGAPLQGNPTDFSRQQDSSPHCTHMYELVALASGMILRGVPRREFATEAPYPIRSATHAILRRDGDTYLQWVIARDAGVSDDYTIAYKHDRIVSPPPFAGQLITRLMPWAKENLDPDMYEATYVLRRAVGLSTARFLDLDTEENQHPRNMFAVKSGDCFTFQTEHAETTRRMIGSTLDFTDHPELLLRDLDGEPPNG